MQTTSSSTWEAKAQVQSILWMGLCFGGLMIAGAGVFLTPKDIAAPTPALRFAMIGVAAMTAVMSLVLPKIVLRQAFAGVAQRLGGGENAGLGMVQVDDAEEARASVMNATNVPLILSMAMSEAVIMMGLALGFLGGRPLETLPLLSIGWLLMAARFPTAKSWFRKFEDQTGISLTQL